MRRWMYMLPLAVVTVGPAASARAQGLSGVVCRKYTQSTPFATPQTLELTSYPAAAPCQPAVYSDSATAFAQPAGVSYGPAPVAAAPGQPAFAQPAGVLYGPAPVAAAPMVTTDGSGAQLSADPAMPEHRGRLFDRLLHRRAEPTASMAPVAMGEPPMMMGSSGVPVDQAVVPVGVQLKAAPMDRSPVPVDFPIRPEFQAQAGHDVNYRSLAGQLYHIHAEGGRWLIRYASMESGDRYGGLVLLDSSSGEFAGFHEGDLVAVHGHLCPEKEGSALINAPVYKADRIDLLQGGAR